MKRLEKDAVLIALADELSLRKSWCGETHLQKSVYFLQELTKVPLGFEFILYKHGPFSFDLRDELTAMRADGLLELQVMPMPYGPSLSPTDTGEAIKARFNGVVNRYKDAVNNVANYLGDKGVAELERLATALFVYTTSDIEKISPTDCAKELSKLKPHVGSEDAEHAAKEISTLLANTH